MAAPDQCPQARECGVSLEVYQICQEIMPLLWLPPLLEDEYITFHFIAQCSALILLWKNNL